MKLLTKPLFLRRRTHATRKSTIRGATGDCTWTLSGTELTVGGRGMMRSYTPQLPPPPWGTAITKAAIRSGVTGIGLSAFSGCGLLTDITISDTVTHIGDWAFSGCVGLTTVAIPGSVKEIGFEAFSGCINLKHVSMADGTECIGYGAFAGCTGLSSVVLPASVIYIVENAFRCCPALTDVYYPGTQAQKEAILIDIHNDALLSATWHCGHADDRAL